MGAPICEWAASGAEMPSGGKVYPAGSQSGPRSNRGNMTADDVIKIVDAIGSWVAGIIVMMGIWKAYRQ